MGARFYGYIISMLTGKISASATNRRTGLFVLSRTEIISFMKKAIPILIAILVCFGVGCTASYFQSESILNWYPTLNKPSFTPPNIAFPIAWSIIYLCMGISIGLLWNVQVVRRQIIIKLFGLQLLFNFTWSIFFFYFQSPLLGFSNILLLDMFVIYYMIESYPVKKWSAWLFIPYILWLLFATYLNGYILVYN